MPRLSIIILSYNTRKITLQCLKSIYASIGKKNNKDVEVIVIDNASTDGSVAALRLFKKTKSNFILVENKKNVGFPRGNNQGVNLAKGEYLLFLNSDVIMKKVDFDELLAYLDAHQNIGVLTVKVLLPSGKIDPASHRGFPNLWNSICYFSRLEKIFSRIPVFNRLFCGYHLSYLDLKTIHEIDSPSGAFYLTRRKIFDQVGGFDDRFFMYGEDLDLSFRIKKLGYKIVYYPLFRVTHIKYASGLGQDKKETKKLTKNYFYEAMKVFYRKHYEKKMPFIINRSVYFFIDLKHRLS